MKNSEETPITNFRLKLIELGVSDPSVRWQLIEIFSDAIMKHYLKGSDDAARIYKGELQKL